MKKCTKCGTIKEDSDFYVMHSRNNNLYSSCKKCCGVIKKEWEEKNREKVKQRNKKWRENNPEKVKKHSKESYLRNREKRVAWGKEYYLKNSDKVKERARKWDLAHPEEVKKRSKKWYALHPDKSLEWNNRWRKNNPDKVLEIQKREYWKNRTTPKVRLSHNVSSCILHSLKRGGKGHRHWEELVGYTLDQLRKHLEKQFTEGMSWENYGEWHVDHIIPVKAFNYETPEDIDFKRCWCLKNLRPLWAKENQSKNCRIDRPFQPSLAIAV